MKVTWSARARTRLADFHPARCFTWYSSHGHDQSGLTAGFSKRLRVRRTSESSTAIDLLMVQNEPILAELNHKRNNNDLTVSAVMARDDMPAEQALIRRGSAHANSKERTARPGLAFRAAGRPGDCDGDFLSAL